MIRAVIFDFDGLILETETAAYQSWMEVYREHGHELPLDRWFDYIGRGAGWFDVAAHLAELVGDAFDRGAAKARRDRRRDEILATLDLMTGVREYMDDARRLGLAIGIASSSSRGWVCGHLERLGAIEGWSAIVCRDDVTNAKPAPDLYVRAMEMLGIGPGEGVALEDSPNGIAAAKAAGLYCVAVPNPVTRDLDLDQADMRLGSLADLPLERLLALLSRA
jgi:HAD superfamily hydrolase (TIGR01509 family)